MGDVSLSDLLPGTSIGFTGGAGILPSTGAIRFPAAPGGAGSKFIGITTRTALTQVADAPPFDIPLLTIYEQPVSEPSFVLGNKEMYAGILVAGANGYVGIATDHLDGSISPGAYFLIRGPDGLAGLKVGISGSGTNNPIFEISDNLGADYAFRYEVALSGYEICRLSSFVVGGFEFRADPANVNPVFWGFEQPVGGVDSHTQMIGGSLQSQPAGPFRWRRKAVTHDNTANYTLSNTELNNVILTVGGTLTAPRNMIGPTTDGAFYIVNNTTTQTITFKTASGTGVAIASTKTQAVYCDGTNYLPAGGAA